MDEITMQDEPSIFHVPTTDYEAKQELSLVPGIFATLVEHRKTLRIKELAIERVLDKLKDANYFKERVNQTQKDAERASKLYSNYDEAYQDYILVYVRREEVEGYLRALEMKAKALDVIIRSEISERHIQR
jgi:hypothetical protein